MNELENIDNINIDDLYNKIVDRIENLNYSDVGIIAIYYSIIEK